jgi:hypothetical protein
VLAGISPDGEILTAGRVDETKRVAGFDLTWSAAKSVSLLFGLRVRRGASGQTNVGAEGLVAAAFTHRTSRVGDPQLHSHVLVANVAKGVTDLPALISDAPGSGSVARSWEDELA